MRHVGQADAAPRAGTRAADVIPRAAGPKAREGPAGPWPHRRQAQARPGRRGTAPVCFLRRSWAGMRARRQRAAIPAATGAAIGRGGARGIVDPRRPACVRHSPRAGGRRSTLAEPAHDKGTRAETGGAAGQCVTGAVPRPPRETRRRRPESHIRCGLTRGGTQWHVGTGPLSRRGVREMRRPAATQTTCRSRRGTVKGGAVPHNAACAVRCRAVRSGRRMCPQLRHVGAARTSRVVMLTGGVLPSGRMPADAQRHAPRSTARARGRGAVPGQGRHRVARGHRALFGGGQGILAAGAAPAPCVRGGLHTQEHETRTARRDTHTPPEGAPSHSPGAPQGPCPPAPGSTTPPPRRPAPPSRTAGACPRACRLRASPAGLFYTPPLRHAVPTASGPPHSFGRASRDSPAASPDRTGPGLPRHTLLPPPPPFPLIYKGRTAPGRCPPSLRPGFTPFSPPRPAHRIRALTFLPMGFEPFPLSGLKKSSANPTQVATADAAPDSEEQFSHEAVATKGETDPSGRQVIHVDWERPYDAGNPQNWGQGKRWYLTLLASMWAFTTALCASAYSPLAGELGKKYHVAKVVILLGNCTLQSSNSTADMFITPLSETVGRVPLYCVCIYHWSPLLMMPFLPTHRAPIFFNKHSSC